LLPNGAHRRDTLPGSRGTNKGKLGSSSGWILSNIFLTYLNFTVSRLRFLFRLNAASGRYMPVTSRFTLRLELTIYAACYSPFGLVPPFDRNRQTMRAEAEALIEAIKQSVGLLRRHL
jgi:hypothetical protein